jgi:import inner membrane translocase subunit TIM54
MVLDPRIAERMRKFVLEPEAEERAKRIASQPTEDSWWKSIWPKKEENKKLWEGLADD